MKKYAVAYMNEYDYELSIQIVDADGWKDALSKHTQFNKPEYPEDHDMSWISDEFEQAKLDMSGSYQMFDVIELNCD